jgi:uncharacterized protein YrrD
MNELRGYTIRATDGDIGEVLDFYFDDDNWTIRYLVAATGGWLMGRKILVAPFALDKVEPDSRRLNVTITKDQVRKSPDIDTDRPVSRQQETAYYDYYGYPYYWAGPYVWGPVPYPAAYPPHPASEPTSVQKEIEAAKQEQEDVHLRSTREVSGYYIEATDGDIGHAEDFLIDDQNWMIRYMVVDTRNWWPGKKVLVSPEWIRSVSWTDSRVRVELSRDAIRNGPEYDPSAPIERDYERRLYEHYRRPAYWGR